jgi:hypothetical protein
MSSQNPSDEACDRDAVDMQDHGTEVGRTAKQNEETTRSARARAVRPFSYKIREASAASGLSTGVLYAAIRQNRLPAFQPHPRAEMLVFRKHLIAFITRFPVNKMALAVIAQASRSAASERPADSAAAERHTE